MNHVVRVLSLATGLALAQSQPPATPQAAVSQQATSQSAALDLAAMVKQQFGSTFTPQANFPTPLITADFDGDGVEDVAIVAVSHEPFPDSYAFKYQVIDPYNSYFGMSNPALSSQFSTVDPTRNHDLLVILGSGAEGWRAAVPKAKFVMINVPFDDIAVGRMLIKKDKPPVFVIKARESQLMDSCVWWDAKKKRWRWQPGDTV